MFSNKHSTWMWVALVCVLGLLVAWIAWPRAWESRAQEVTTPAYPVLLPSIAAERIGNGELEFAKIDDHATARNIRSHWVKLDRVNLEYRELKLPNADCPGGLEISRVAANQISLKDCKVGQLRFHDVKATVEIQGLSASSNVSLNTISYARSLSLSGSQIEGRLSIDGVDILDGVLDLSGTSVKGNVWIRRLNVQVLNLTSFRWEGKLNLDLTGVDHILVDKENAERIHMAAPTTRLVY